MEPLKTNVKVIFALTLVHFTGDFYASFINPLLPVFLERFALSLTQIGFLAGITRLLAFIVQPAAGYIADHYRTRIFVVGGPLMAMTFISLVGIAPNFWVLVIFISLGSIGQSMFHPSSAGMISTYAGPHFNFSMSIFNTGGTFAFGLGPLFIAYVVRTYGLEATPMTLIIGLPLMVLIFILIPFPEGEGLGKLGFIGSIKESIGTVWRSIVIIWVIMVLRAFVGQSFQTFIPVLYTQEGYSLISVGTMISLFTVAGALSGLLAGRMADRTGYKPIFYITHGLTTPALLMLLIVPGNWVFMSAFIAGFFTLATLPLGVAMAQELAPKGKSIVSSLMMGLAFGTGGMMSPLSGKLADMYSIRTVLYYMAIIPILTTFLVYFLPEKKRH